MPRHITDQEYDYLQGRRQIADFAETVFNDPALTKDAQRLIKRKYPQMKIPELDLEDKVEARFAEERRARDEADAAARQTKEEENWRNLRKTTQDRYGFTDEAMTDLEKMMVERNIGDYDVAASYKAAKDPKPSTGDFNSGRWDHEKAPGFAEIAKDPEGWGRNEILKAIYADNDRSRGR